MTREEFEKTEFEKLDWDVVINGKPYQVVKPKAATSKVVDRDGSDIDIVDIKDELASRKYYAYPLNETMTFENLIRYDGWKGATWEVDFANLDSIRDNGTTVRISKDPITQIIRNHSIFYESEHGEPFESAEAMLSYVINGAIKEHPLNLDSRDFDKKCIGRKLKFKNVKAVIKEYINGEAKIIIKPDGASEFPIFPTIDGGVSPDQIKKDEMIVSIFSKDIKWD